MERQTLTIIDLHTTTQYACNFKLTTSSEFNIKNVRKKSTLHTVRVALKTVIDQ